MTLTQGVLGNDSDATGLKAILDSGPAHGDLELHEDGSFVYRPDPDYSGPDEFTYRRAGRDGGISRSATVAISIDRSSRRTGCASGTPTKCARTRH